MEEYKQSNMFIGASPKLTFLFGLALGFVIGLIVAAILIIPQLYGGQ